MSLNSLSGCTKLRCLFRVVFRRGPRNRVKQGQTGSQCPPYRQRSSLPAPSHRPSDARTSDTVQPEMCWTDSKLSKAHIPAPLISSPSSARRSGSITPLGKHVDMGSVGHNCHGVLGLKRSTELLRHPDAQGGRDGTSFARKPAASTAKIG